AYVVALAASLVVALTVTPALCSFLLPKAKSVLRGHEAWLVHRLKSIYQPHLNWVLDHVGFVIACSMLLLCLAFSSFFFMGRSFLPAFNEGTLTISAVTLPGTSLAESDQLGRALERILLSVPEVVSTARRTGRAELDEHVQGVESAELDVNLQMKVRPKEQVLQGLRAKTTLMPGMHVTLVHPLCHSSDQLL